MIGRTIKLFISLIYYACQMVKTKMGSVLGKQRLGGSVVLEYHSVKANQINKFASQMDELERIGIAVSADLGSTFGDNKHRVAVTFDDGFKSVVDHALPIMAERRIPATIFVTTGYLGKRPEWITNPRHSNFDEVIVSKEEIEKLRFDLVRIGSHCVNHRNLSNSNCDEAVVELLQSKRALECIIGKPVYLLSFPYGGYNDQILGLAKKLGYKQVFMNVPVSKKLAQDGYVTGRINVTLDDWLLEFRLKALGAYQWLVFGMKAKQRLMGLFGS